MITLASECLVFKNGSGEAVPLSAEMISVELSGETSKYLDEDVVREAAKAVFHFFKHDLGRETVTMAEFAEALEGALDGFKPQTAKAAPARVQEANLLDLARRGGESCELIFFSRLRNEVRLQLKDSPGVLRFSGLRCCVKQLTGAQRWSDQCRSLEDQIVYFLRECLRTEARDKECALVVQ